MWWHLMLLHIAFRDCLTRTADLERKQGESKEERKLIYMYRKNESDNIDSAAALLCTRGKGFVPHW